MHSGSQRECVPSLTMGDIHHQMNLVSFILFFSTAIWWDLGFEYHKSWTGFHTAMGAAFSGQAGEVNAKENLPAQAEAPSGADGETV